jgi:hypothetical protein
MCLAPFLVFRVLVMKSVMFLLMVPILLAFV